MKTRVNKLHTCICQISCHHCHTSLYVYIQFYFHILCMLLYCKHNPSTFLDINACTLQHRDNVFHLSTSGKMTAYGIFVFGSQRLRVFWTLLIWLVELV